MVLVIKNPPTNTRNERNSDLVPGSGRSLEKEMATHSSISCLENPMERRQRNLEGSSPWGHKESVMTELTHTHTHTVAGV